MLQLWNSIVIEQINRRVIEGDAPIGIARAGQAQLTERLAHFVLQTCSFSASQLCNFDSLGVDQMNSSSLLVSERQESCAGVRLRQYDALGRALLPPPLAWTCSNHGLERTTEGRLVREPRLLGHFRQSTAGV